MLNRLRQIQADPLAFLLDCAERYGGINGIRLGNMNVYLVHDPTLVEQVLLHHHARYSKNTFQYNALSSITGRGLLTNHGADWLKHRRLAQPAFARPRLMALDRIIVPATQAMLDRWDRYLQKNETIDVDAEMMQLALEIVGKALFSIDLSKEASRLTSAVITCLDHIIYRAKHLVVPPDSFPTARNLRFKRALRALDQAVYEIMAQRRKQEDLGEDLLGMFLKARDKDTGEPMSDQEIRDEILTMLIAGHETVASALTWSWYLLSLHPDVRRRLRNEVEQVLGQRTPSSEDLEKLPLTEQVFSEALRLFPPAWIITRRAEEEDTLAGYSIPVGSLMIISPYVVHRLPSVWENPLGFDPDRFSTGEKEGRERFRFIPFGGGPRLCIGNQFAMIEARLILAMVVQRFHLDLLPAYPLHVEPLVTLRPRSGLPMRVVSWS